MWSFNQIWEKLEALKPSIELKTWIVNMKNLLIFSILLFLGRIYKVHGAENELIAVDLDRDSKSNALELGEIHAAEANNPILNAVSNVAHSFSASEMRITKLASFMFSFISNSLVTCLTRNNYFAALFAGTQFESNYFIWILIASRLSRSIAGILTSFSSARNLADSHFSIYLSLGLSIVGVALLMLFPAIQSQVRLSSTLAMSIVVILASYLGFVFGPCRVLSGSFLNILPKSTVKYSVMGRPGSDFFFNVVYFVSSAFAGSLGQVAPGSCNASCDSVSFVTSEITEQYQGIMGMELFFALATVAILYYFLKTHLYQVCSVRGAQDQHHKAHDSEELSNMDLIFSYPSGAYLWSIFISNTLYAFILPVVYANVGPVDPDPSNLFKSSLFLPTAYLLDSIFGMLGTGAAGYLPSTNEPSKWIIFSPLPQAMLCVLLLLCNFKSQGVGSKSGIDPFPNAPRLIKSDVAYFFLVAAGSFCYNISLCLLNTNIRHTVASQEDKKQLGALASLFLQLGLNFGSFFAFAIYYSLCNCNPFNPAA